MSATVLGTTEASGLVISAIIDNLMKTLPGNYQVTIAYGHDPRSTQVFNLSASSDLQIDITNAIAISQLEDPKVVGIIKVS